MQVDLTRNYYELFEMPVQFELDNDHLTSRFRALQKALHPDRFAGATDTCLLYTSPSPRDGLLSRMPSSA